MNCLRRAKSKRNLTAAADGGDFNCSVRNEREVDVILLSCYFCNSKYYSKPVSLKEFGTALILLRIHWWGNTFDRC